MIFRLSAHAQNNLQKLPPIKRAREHYLYAADQRYLDLYGANGSVLWGHRPANRGVALKNALDQGLSIAYPNLWQNRLVRALHRLYPKHNIGLYLNTQDLDFLPPKISEPWHPSDVHFLRPAFMELKGRYGILVLPDALNLLTIVISHEELPMSQLIPAFIARSALRFTDRLECPVNAELVSFFDGFSPLWQRHHRYLEPVLPVEAYQQLFDRALEHNILLPPSPRLTGLIPLSLSKGEMAMLKKIFETSLK